MDKVILSSQMGGPNGSTLAFKILAFIWALLIPRNVLLPAQQINIITYEVEFSLALDYECKLHWIFNFILNA